MLPNPPNISLQFFCTLQEQTQTTCTQVGTYVKPYVSGPRMSPHSLLLKEEFRTVIKKRVIKSDCTWLILVLPLARRDTYKHIRTLNNAHSGKGRHSAPAEVPTVSERPGLSRIWIPCPACIFAKMS